MVKEEKGLEKRRVEIGVKEERVEKGKVGEKGENVNPMKQEKGIIEKQQVEKGVPVVKEERLEKGKVGEKGENVKPVVKQEKGIIENRQVDNSVPVVKEEKGIIESRQVEKSLPIVKEERLEKRVGEKAESAKPIVKEEKGVIVKKIEDAKPILKEEDKKLRLEIRETEEKNGEPTRPIVKESMKERIEKRLIEKREDRGKPEKREEEGILEIRADKGKSEKRAEEEVETRQAETPVERARPMIAQPNGYFHDPDNNAYVLKSKDEETELSVSSELYNHLFDYQREGVKWMWGLFVAGKGGILGDDMGLGKTMQVVGFLGSMIRSGHISRSLVVMPVSVLEHWKAELEKWGERIRVKVFHGTSKKEREESLHRVKSR